MGTIFNLFMVLIIIASVLLVIIIMAQNPKGGGLSSTFGGSSAQFGVQRTNDFMEKATWVLASIIVILIFLSVVLTAKPTANYDTAPVKSEKSTSAPQAPTQKATNLPTTK
ncbi:preprotein translocase subunit SecG [Cloacibacterium sp.]|uniref:preprotein translocase subunit SecG n=1 Tax=Cloacibacterium sp. TaxID=1913682 RepID=UPI0035ADD04A